MYFRDSNIKYLFQNEYQTYNVIHHLQSQYQIEVQYEIVLIQIQNKIENEIELTNFIKCFF